MDRGMDHISKLPKELLQNIFKHVDPLDLAPLALSCREFAKFIEHNAHLFKAVYLEHLDEPVLRKGSSWDWEEEIHKFARFRRILRSETHDTVEKKVLHLEFISEYVARLVRCTTQGRDSKNVQLLEDYLDGRVNKEAFFCQSQTYKRSRLRNVSEPLVLPSRAACQASAKLHTYFGVPIRSLCRSRYKSSYPYAVSMVYDMRNYTGGTLWGPFLPDGRASVDWEKMEAVMVVLGHNLREFTASTSGLFRPLWTTPWQGVTPDSFKSLPLKGRMDPAPEVDFEDPYNITGSWMRIVCFLDFHELFHYNFTGAVQPANVPRPPLETVEAIRLIMMDLQATKREDPGPEDGQDYPVVHFFGTARSMHSSWDPNANSNIRGTVRQTKEGEIRWTSISVYNGEERWKSEGIQIGGPKSARGVLGHWFDREWDMHGPAGPTAFWKISDDRDDRTPLQGEGHHHHHHHHHHHIGGDDVDFTDEETDDEEYGNENGNENENENGSGSGSGSGEGNDHTGGNEEEDGDEDGPSEGNGVRDGYIAVPLFFT